MAGVNRGASCRTTTSQIAIDELIRLAKEVGMPIEDRPEFQILWDARLIMAATRSAGKNRLQRRGFIPQGSARGA